MFGAAFERFECYISSLAQELFSLGVVVFNFIWTVCKAEPDLGHLAGI